MYTCIHVNDMLMCIYIFMYVCMRTQKKGLFAKNQCVLVIPCTLSFVELSVSNQKTIRSFTHTRRSHMHQFEPSIRLSFTHVLESSNRVISRVVRGLSSCRKPYNSRFDGFARCEMRLPGRLIRPPTSHTHTLSRCRYIY